MSTFNPGTYQSGDGNLNEPIVVGRLGQPLKLGGGTDYSNFATYTSLAERPAANIFGSGICRIGHVLYISDSLSWNELNGVIVNDIGVAGSLGFGVGVPSALPTGFSAMAGSSDKYSDNYGNYTYTDGSVMVWIPLHYFKYGTGSNGLAVNIVDIKPVSFFYSVSEANAAGYFIPRAFYNAGTVRQGVFVDKYQCSNNGGIASSIKFGLPLSSASTHNPFSGLNGAPANFYYGSIAAVKTRGSAFFTPTVFIYHMLAMLSLAHGQSATSTTECAWYDSTGVKNFPKGNNNNALGDTNDTTLAFVSDGYPNCAKTGASNNLAKTTHNGQANGITDLNGNIFEIALGITSDATNFYVLKTSVDAAALTEGVTLATDAWGATGIAAQYDSLGATYESLTASSTAKLIGNAAQVFSDAVTGTAWAAAGSGIPLLGGTGGTNMFGNDAIYDYRTNLMCPVVGGSWASGAFAGIWLLNLSYARSASFSSVGFRASLYI
jgi:hypothetical protein